MENYDIEAVVTVDARGQIVLPKEVRNSLGLEQGSKLAVVVMRRGGAPCCISLMPAASFEETARGLMNPRAETKS